MNFISFIFYLVLCRTQGDERMCFIQLMEESGALSCEVVVREPSLLHLSSTLHLHKDCLLSALRIVCMKVDSKVGIV